MDEPADSPRDRASQEGDGRHLPVLASSVSGGRPPEIEAVEARPVDRPAQGDLPTPLAVAAGGFVAGFATVALARLVRGRGLRRLARARGRPVLGREIESSRSFLIDVHVLKR